MVRFAVICASNQNRSMEGHRILQQHGFDVESYGTGSLVRLPGPSADKPNIYKFGTPYDTMYHQLLEQNQKLYTRNGLLRMLDRNRRIKKAPQRWQESTDVFDVIITCEERCWRAVMEDLLMRSMISEQVGELGRPVHVVNVDIKDNHTDAALGGKLILEIAKSLEEADDLDGQISDILNSVQESTHHPLLHSIAFY